MAVAGAACALAQPADDTTARVRKATADTQKQTAAVGALHQRVDVLEAQSAKASSELAAKDKAIADLRAQLAQAKAKGAAPAVSNRVPAPSH
jgi:cell division protein FtsB